MGGALETEIHEQITRALKARDTVRRGTLRMLAAAITNRGKELRRELTDDEVREVAAVEVKRRSESIEAFSGAGRTELADKEREERDVLTAYAPVRLSEAEVDALIDEAIASTGATSSKEIGAVMGAVMSRAKGRVDGGDVQRKVRERLGG